MLKSCLRSVLKAAGLILVFNFIAGLALFLWYTRAYPSMDDFCAGVPDTATPEFIADKAKKLGAPVFDDIKERNQISVWNHLAPFFRRSCVIEFENGRVSGKRAAAAD